MSPQASGLQRLGGRHFAFCVSIYCGLFLSHFGALAETPDPKILVKAALEKLDATALDDDWSFTMAVTEGDELRLVHSDPQREQSVRRQLLAVNGEAPDEDRLEEFREAEKKRIDDIDPDTAGYIYMVNVETLQVLERGAEQESAQGDAYLKFSFTPRVRALEKSQDLLRGTLELNTESQQIEKIELHNTGALSPAFSVTVDTYRLALTFAPEQGENLIHTLQSHAVGKAGFLKSFDSLVDITFSDYKRAAP